jgi:glycosyltransferase involved in cell wall biosynthesis
MPTARQPLCILSTYPPQRCGIGAYTAELARAIAATGAPVGVLSERGAAEGTADGVTSYPTWDRREDWVTSVLARVQALGAQTVHLQHTPDTLGWDDRVPRLLDGLAQRGVATAITLHTVHTLGTGLIEGRFRPAHYHRRLAARASVVVVHGTAAQADALQRQGVPAEKVVVIPHGTKVFSPPPPAESRARLGLASTGPILLYFGFIHVFKNLHTIIRAMARLAPRVPGVQLVVVGSIQNRGWYNLLYLQYCRRLVRALGLEGQVELREAFAPVGQIADLFGAADLVLFPHAQHYGSASGALHSALGAGKMVICSESPKFAEIAEHVSPDLRVATYAPEAWAERIGRLLRDDAARETLAARIRAYAEETAWPQIAALHLALYPRLRPANEAAGLAQRRSGRPVRPGEPGDTAPGRGDQ